jgi:putative RecB family exonuclease
MKSARYSHSRLSTYQNCPRQFAYAYIERPEIPEGPESIESLMGSLVHESLERLYRMCQMERVLTLEELLADFSERWERARAALALVRRPDLTAADYFNVGRACLEKYHRRYAPFNKGQTLGIELEIALDLGDGLSMTGYIDRLDRVGDAGYEIHDYKTSGHLPLQAEADADRQLALYQIAVQERFPDAARVALVWHYLRFDTEIRSVRTPEALETLKGDIRSLVAEIEKCAVFPTRVSALCDYCDYKPLCPAWRHAVALESPPARQFEKEDGARLVDRFVELREKRRELAREHGRLEEEIRREERALLSQIAAFAKQHGYERVFGSDRVATVSARDAWELPRKDDELYAALVSRCQQLGIWDRVSQLNRAALTALLDADTDLAARLADLAGRKSFERVSIAMRKDKEK